MNNRHLTIIGRLIVTIIAIGFVFYSWKLYDENHFDVPGTVIAKSQLMSSHCHGRRVYSSWAVAVKPDNASYKPYNVCVDFATFSTLNVGSHVTFNVMSDQVDPEGHNDFLSIVFGAVGLVVLYFMIVRYVFVPLGDMG